MIELSNCKRCLEDGELINLMKLSKSGNATETGEIMQTVNEFALSPADASSSKQSAR